MSYYPDGCSQDAFDRANDDLGGWDEDTTLASCGHFESESRLTYRPDGTSLCVACDRETPRRAPGTEQATGKENAA